MNNYEFSLCFQSKVEGMRFVALIHEVLPIHWGQEAELIPGVTFRLPGVADELDSSEA